MTDETAESPLNDTERAALALIEATVRQDMPSGVAMLTSSTRDELIGMSAVLATYVVAVASMVEDFDLAEWVPEQRQRLLEAERGDDPPTVA